ncbi:hypothetical protein ACHAXT_008099 [Thalassiosira profunda]
MAPLLISSLAVALLAPSYAAAAAHPASVSPQRIAFDALAGAGADDASTVLTAALQHDGLVSITGVPSFRETKQEVLSIMHACLVEVEAAGGKVATHRFDDGTVRRSFATSTTPTGGAQPIKPLEDFEGLPDRSTSEACRAFRKNVSSFRGMTDRVTGWFAQRLSSELDASLPRPLLSSNSAERGDYEDVAQVVAGGEHLEHFHSYQKVGGETSEETTIEFHTDQGLFIAFTPGLIVSEDSLEPSDGFYIQDSSGERKMVEFTQEDELVFMLGDGVNKIINSKLADDRNTLHGTPHALVLPVSKDASNARVWYGRMVLPPNDALLPGTDTTFGQVRQSLVDSSSKGDGIPLGIGCSSPSSKAAVQTSRNLHGPDVDDNGCAADELFCWFRCMELALHDATTCSERNLGVQCMNPRGQILEAGAGHGDYYPACTNRTHETHPVTPYPEIDQQDPEACTDEEWEEFSSEGDYYLEVDLTVPDDGTETVLRYSIVGETDSLKVKARLVHRDVFGWLGLGFANVATDAPKNGMNGGNVLLAKPGGDYSPVTGLNTTLPGSVATYQIHPTESSFRHWMDPIETDEAMSTVADFESNECFTAFTFESDHINGQKFNLGGEDEMIWAANSVDHFMGYHGSNRARFTMDWGKGEMHFHGQKPAEQEPEQVELVNGGEPEQVESVNGGTIGMEPTSGSSVGNLNSWAYASLALAALIHQRY